jgi:uncharacterized protein (DUF2235 family)
MLMAINTIDSKNGNRSAEEKRYFNLAADFKSTFSTQICKPWFVGVWDTVSSIGWYENPLRLPYTSNNPDIEIGRHAIAIDERRAFFRTNLWMPKDCPSQSGPRDLKQVWFPGVHGDVGGGYPEAESGLSKIALQWMLNEAINAGLLVSPGRMDLVLRKNRRLRRPRRQCDDARVADATLVARRNSLETTLQLDEASIWTPGQSRTPAHNSCWLVHP